MGKGNKEGWYVRLGVRLVITSGLSEVALGRSPEGTIWF